jgi:conjugative relaxase-like TrwC/TraI family protein
MIQSQSSGHAKAYFNDALAKSDYYMDDQELQGRFQGLVAGRIGLDERTTKEAFFDLCENINPKTGGSLTQRTIEQRTVGYDINFHCPKSVSLIHALSKDDHILEAFEASVSDTMKDIEADSKTRIRKHGQYDDRETGELLWTEFIHQTARPVDGQLPDPHLHAHCFTFNVTWDEKEKQLKAGQFRDIKRDMPYYEARFHKRLSDNLIKLGYGIRKTDKFFEIEGVPQDALDLFSKRTNEIGQIAKAKGITDAKKLDELGARTRSKKQKGHSMTELKSEWVRQIKNAGLDRENQTVRQGKRDIESITPEQCVDYALQHRFERMSVIQDRRILETSYRHAIGKRVPLDMITKSFHDDKRIIHVKEKWRKVCTTKEVLAEEKRMVDLANKARGKFIPLYKPGPEINLKGEQYEAAHHVLTTTHGVSIIKGRAGAGKTTLMKELVNLMEKTNCKVTMTAPTAEAARGVLRHEGFSKADTVAKLLIDKELQADLMNGALVVDEAGLLGTKDMTSLLDLTAKKNARLILVGDTRQHSSVIRGDALRILNTVGGIRSAEVSRIYRQKPKEYREAVQALSEGNVGQGFEKLDAINAIKTIDPLKPNEQLIEDYITSIKKGKSVLVISPTHSQGEETTAAIRKKLRETKRIGKKEVKLRKLINLNQTQAEKSDPRNYKPGFVLQFNQNMKGIKRGSTWTVNRTNEDFIEAMDGAGKTVNIPLGESEKFDAFQDLEIGRR